MIVIDASVWISAISPFETRQQESLRWLRGWVEAGRLLIAPSLFLAEVSGAISRRTEDPLLAHQAVANVLETPNFSAFEGDALFWRQCAQIAASHRLRGADAAYVATAALFQVPLVTWDREQLERGGLLVETRQPVTDR